MGWPFLAIGQFDFELKLDLTSMKLIADGCLIGTCCYWRRGL